MADKSLIAIGKVVAPHGVRGDVRVIPLTDFPDRFNNLAKVLLEDKTTLQVEYARSHKQFTLVKFRGYNDRNAVEALRGKLLMVSREDVAALPEGHYYIFDIIGLQVYDEDGNHIGEVKDVISTGSNDVYITESEGKPPVLIPALKEVVKNIDVPGGKIIVRLQEELE
jgi:16S rRNA processing protein RimM